MTKNEFKSICEQGGVSKEAIKKIQEEYDVDKMTKAVESARTPKEAMEALHKLYPTLDVKEMKAQYEFYEEQSRELSGRKKEKKLSKPMELTTDELEHVAGGASSWISKNWKKLLIGIAAALAVVLVVTGVGAAVGGSIGATFAAAGGGVSAKAIVFSAMGAIGAGYAGYQLGPEAKAALTDSSANWQQNL